MMQATKGSTLRTTQDYIAGEFGIFALDAVLARMEEADRLRIRELTPTEEVAYPLLISFWHAADQVLGATRADWPERSGAHAIDSLGLQLYSGILRKTSPAEFLTQRVSLFRLYYQPGNMEVVEEAADRAILRLVGFDAVDPLFCRRQTGGLQRSVELAGGRNAITTHTRCALDGDAFCEWELRWA